MPTPSTAKWPRPRSEDEWEEMVLDAMRLRWTDPDAQRNGRRGQRQHGVDIFGMDGEMSVGAQAKNMDSLSERNALAEIAKAEGFSPQLDKFYFVIGGPCDAKFQEFVRLLSASRKSAGKFSVHVIFFEDVCQTLAAEDTLLLKYWRDFIRLVELAKALPKALAGPILSSEEAFTRIEDLEEYKAYATELESLTDNEVHACIRLDSYPDFSAPSDSRARSWQVAIGESHEARMVTLCHVSIEIASGDLLILAGGESEWLTFDEWLQTGPWFLR